MRPALFLFIAAIGCLHAHALDIRIDNYGWPGATMAQVRSKLFDTETTMTHHEIWIVEGGLNDLNYTNGDYRLAQEQMTSNWLQIRDHARNLGVDVYFSEVVPVAPNEDAKCTWIPVAPKIQALNLHLAVLAQDYKLNTIGLYDDLEPHWTSAADAWCKNFANCGTIDGAHPNALGSKAIADHYYAALRAGLVRNGPKSIAIFGDSIVATTYLPVDQRIEAVMKAAAASERSAMQSRAWQYYE